MRQLDESLEVVKNILMQKGLVVVLINEFYQDIDYDHGELYEKEILDSIHEILNIGCPKDVKVTI